MCRGGRGSGSQLIILAGLSWLFSLPLYLDTKTVAHIEGHCTAVTKRTLNPERSVLFTIVFSITVFERAVAHVISIVITGEIERSKPTLFPAVATPPSKVVATIQFPVGVFLGGVCMFFPSGCFGFVPQSKEMPVRSIRDSKLP